MLFFYDTLLAMLPDASLAEVRPVPQRLYRSSDGNSIQLDLDDETGLRVALLQVQLEVVSPATVRSFHLLEEVAKPTLAGVPPAQVLNKSVYSPPVRLF